MKLALPFAYFMIILPDTVKRDRAHVLVLGWLGSYQGSLASDPPTLCFQPLTPPRQASIAWRRRGKGRGGRGERRKKRRGRRER